MLTLAGALLIVAGVTGIWRGRLSLPLPGGRAPFVIQDAEVKVVSYVLIAIGIAMVFTATLG